MERISSGHSGRALLTVVLLASSMVFAKGPHEGGSSVAPTESLKRLEVGNRQFAVGKGLLRAGAPPAVRRKLAGGQRPHAVVVACSDSRVPPELLFNQGLGQLFVVRVAGNGLDAVGLASVEYALEHLGARLIVVLGHESCGAVKAALGTPEGASAGSPNLDALVAAVKGNLKGTQLTDADRADPKVATASRANVNGVVRHLLQSSALVREKVEAGTVVVVPGVYALDTGRVDFWDTEKQATTKTD